MNMMKNEFYSGMLQSESKDLIPDLIIRRRDPVRERAPTSPDMGSFSHNQSL